ncbi:hypothetical protein HELRODRAFT_166000 [Helobdella robusta]|uniref:SUEL-type lectin domain-containing protein n=1 Tax=Helobdella robusta TaxID=6412 RepID=T1EXK2_HELRO|nr:hypothetical protein HELRODRAFT_166000 [Helobdella robusta]ESN90342.1 hypothetical protein HELRODRAFT_166000 [Helobdella robusta]
MIIIMITPAKTSTTTILQYGHLFFRCALTLDRCCSNPETTGPLMLPACDQRRLKEPREYCTFKHFNVTCSKLNDVILMTSARYGRMANSQCIMASDASVGCWTEVLHYMDRKCSGKRSCFVRIPNAKMHRQQPCAKDLLTYLEADYQCLTVETVSNAEDTCQEAGHSTIHLKDSTSGWLSSEVSMATKVGSIYCPWVLVVSKGQTLKDGRGGFMLEVGEP